MTARGNSASSGVLTETARLPEEKNMPKFVTIGYGDQAGYDEPRALPETWRMNMMPPCAAWAR